MMPHADPHRLFASMPIVVGEITEPGDNRIEHRNIDELAFPGFFPLIKREQNPDRRVHARRDICNCNSGARRLVGIAGGRDNSALTLNQQIISFDVAVRSVLPVAGKRAIDEPRIELAQFFIAQSKSCSDAGRIVFKENICTFCESLENFPSLIFLDINGETAFVAVQPDVSGRQSFHDRIPRSDNIADTRSLDLDYFRAHVGQQARGKRPRQNLLESQDLHSIQRTMGFIIAHQASTDQSCCGKDLSLRSG